MLNCKVICTQGNNGYMTEGKTYEFENGKLKYDNGEVTRVYDSIEAYNREPFFTKVKRSTSHACRLALYDIVKTRDGCSFIALTEAVDPYLACEKDESLLRISRYTPDLRHVERKEYDVMSVTSIVGTVKYIREEKSKEELEYENVEKEISELKQRRKELLNQLLMSKL